MIKVGLKWEPGAQYIGRGSALGNPFVMKHEGERDEVCEKYEVWFKKKVAENDPRVMNELRRLFVLHRKQGQLTLGCFCAPKRCHGETIKRFLDQFE